MNLNYLLLLVGCILLLLFLIIFKHFYYSYFIPNIRVRRLILNENNDHDNENNGNDDDLPKYSDIVPRTASEPPSYNEFISNRN